MSLTSNFIISGICPLHVKKMCEDWTNQYSKNSPEWNVNEVYNTLAQFEEFVDYSNGSKEVDMLFWLREKYEKENDNFKKLLKEAFIIKQSEWKYTELYGPPWPDRPSLFLIHNKWMRNNGYDFIADPLEKSIFPIIETSNDIIELLD